MNGKFLVLIEDKKYGSSAEEHYTVKQVLKYLENVVEELDIIDVQEIDSVHTTIKSFLGDYI
jgi:hypothetical protein